MLLDFVLEHAGNDERPYLTVEILGKSVMGLLDSGASRTILGGIGNELVRELGLQLDTSKTTSCTVANGNRCVSVGVVLLPVSLRGRLRVIEALVIPELPHILILGQDFWRVMGIVPDLRHNEWHFSNEPVLVNNLDHIRQQTVLSPTEKIRLQAVIERSKEIMGSELGCTNRAEHVIKTNSDPIKQRYYRVSPVVQAHIDKELDEMLRMGIVEPSISPWASPILLVKKKDGSYRFCVDYRKLNAVTEKDSYPLPMVSDTLDKLRNARYLSSLDVKSAFWQVPVAESSRKYTAFTVPNRGLFQFNRMPFGLSNAPATWQRLIDNVLGSDLEPFVFVYLDDVVVVSDTFEKHLFLLDEVFRRLREANITVSFDKCQFCRPEMKFLGYVVDRNGLHVDPEKVTAMLELPVPKTVSDVRRLVGTFSWYRRFIADFSTIIAPITNLLKKSSKFVWSEECEESFKRIKEFLVTAPILTCPDYSKPFVVQTDASGFGLGAVLTQPSPDGDKVVCYLSRSLSKQERRYTTTERECLAVLWAIEKLRPYLEGVEFTVLTDHWSLIWLQNLKDPTGRLARWAVKLQQFQFKILHRKGKDMVVPDALSRSVPVVDLLSVRDDTPVLSDKIDDRWYKKMLEKVTNYPLRFSSWRINNGKLWKYVKSVCQELISPKETWKLVIPKDDRRKLITLAHEPPTSGHVGVYKTFSRLCERYYWPKMRSDVENFVKRCKVCTAHKPSQQQRSDKMVSHPKANTPWEMITTDLIGPLPKSKRGNAFILVVSDYLSKFTLLFPLRKSSTETIIRHLENDVFMLFGTPRILLCDNGPQFRSSKFIQFTQSHGTKIKFTPNYHPRANPTERINRVIKTMLSIYVSDNHRSWDENLQQIACAIRTSKHEVMQLSPYFVNFGRHMIICGDDYDKYVTDMEEEFYLTKTRNSAFRKMYSDVKKRLEVANEKSCNAYNLRRRDIEYLPNQIVWRKNYVLSDASKFFTHKLAPKYIGPFYINKRLSRWSYELRDELGNHKGVWHTKDLKPNPSDD